MTHFGVNRKCEPITGICSGSNSFRAGQLLLPALSNDQAAGLRTKFEHAERQAPENLDQFDGFHTYSHLVILAISQLALDSRITDWVSAILGQHLLLLHTSIFVKEPMTEKFVSWHQDLVY